MATRAKGAHQDAKRANAVMCPLRFGDPCTLCMPYVNGPEDCQSVALVMSDPDLKAEWAKGFSAWKRKQRALREQESLRKKQSPCENLIPHEKGHLSESQALRENQHLNEKQQVSPASGSDDADLLNTGAPRFW